MMLRLALVAIFATHMSCGVADHGWGRDRGRKNAFLIWVTSDKGRHNSSGFHRGYPRRKRVLTSVIAGNAGARASVCARPIQLDHKLILQRGEFRDAWASAIQEVESAQLLFQPPQDGDGRKRFGVLAHHVVIHDRDGGGANRVHGRGSFLGGFLRLDGAYTSRASYCLLAASRAAVSTAGAGGYRARSCRAGWPR